MKTEEKVGLTYEKKVEKHRKAKLKMDRLVSIEGSISHAFKNCLDLSTCIQIIACISRQQIIVKLT